MRDAKNQAIWAILGYCISSIVMTVTNKYVLSAYSFKMNFLLLAIQGASCVGVLSLFTLRGKIDHRPFNAHDGRKWAVVSFSLVGMIYTGSKAIQYLSIPIFLIFKNITIIIIAYGEKVFFGGSNVSKLMLFSFGLMVLSSAIAGYSDITSGQMLKDESNGVIVPYIWMILNCLTTAFYVLIMRSKIKEVGFKDYDTVYYNNLMSIPTLLILSLLSERQAFYDTWEKYTVIYPEQFNGLVGAILFSGVMTFGISYCTSWCMRVTSSTTYSMVGALNKLPIAVFGIIVFSDTVTTGKVLGILIAFTAGIIYTRAKQLQNSKNVLQAKLKRDGDGVYSNVKETIVHMEMMDKNGANHHEEDDIDYKEVSSTSSSSSSSSLSPSSTLDRLEKSNKM